MIKIFVIIPPSANNGVGYYRQILPLLVAEKRGLCKLVVKHFDYGKTDYEKGDKVKDITNLNDTKNVIDLEKYSKWADIVYFARNDVPHYISIAGGIIQEFRKPTVVDFDDLVSATRPHNPGYRSFHPNSQNIQFNIKSLGIYNGVITSTDYIKNHYKRYTNSKEAIAANIECPFYVCPNSLDWDQRDKDLKIYKKKNKKKKDEIRIGWSGSSAHWENLKRIEPAIIEIMKKYPNVTFHLTGLFGDIFEDKEIQDRIVKVGFTDLRKYHKKLLEMNLDIAIAPLCDNEFNRAKSNLRLLEYASCKYPIIASPVEPYKSFKGKVLFATEINEWIEQLDKLIKNEVLRKEYGERSYKYAKDNYNINNNCELWIKSLKDIKKRFDKKFAVK